MDEVFGEENFVAQIALRRRPAAQLAIYLPDIVDYILWYAQRHERH